MLHRDSPRSTIIQAPTRPSWRKVSPRGVRGASSHTSGRSRTSSGGRGLGARASLCRHSTRRRPTSSLTGSRPRRARRASRGASSSTRRGWRVCRQGLESQSKFDLLSTHAPLNPCPEQTLPKKMRWQPPSTPTRPSRMIRARRTPPRSRPTVSSSSSTASRLRCGCLNDSWVSRATRLHATRFRDVGTSHNPYTNVNAKVKMQM